jgi:hypothetical protein
LSTTAADFKALGSSRVGILIIDSGAAGGEIGDECSKAVEQDNDDVLDELSSLGDRVEEGGLFIDKL